MSMLVEVVYRLRARKDQRRWRGLAYENGRVGRRAVVHLNIENKRRKDWHRSYDWMVRDISVTKAHEIIQALIKTSDWAKDSIEEEFLLRFDQVTRACLGGRAVRWASR